MSTNILFGNDPNIKNVAGTQTINRGNKTVNKSVKQDVSGDNNSTSAGDLFMGAKKSKSSAKGGTVKQRKNTEILIVATDDEGTAAQQLKKELETLFTDQKITCLCIAGKNWCDAVQQGIAAAGVVLFLLGSKSSAETWPAYVTGAADTKELPAFPLIHSGVTPQTLPAYCATMEAVEICTGTGFKQLCEHLAKEFGITSEWLNLNWELPAHMISQRLT